MSDLLDVQVALILENNQRVVYSKCLISDETMMITSKTTGGLPAVPALLMRSSALFCLKNLASNCWMSVVGRVI